MSGGNVGVADLHMHTTSSDGTSTVEERIQQAHEKNIEVIAITDHGCISSELNAGSEKRGDVEVITGVEIRADLLDTKIEILGYFIDPENEELSYVLETARDFRETRNRELISNLNDATGLSLSYRKLKEEVGGELGRPHLADRLVSEGLADSIGHAFDEYLGSDGDVYVSMERVHHREVIEAVHSAGGITSLAHPGRISGDKELVFEIMGKLVERGLDGIEVWYPYGEIDSGRYADIGVEDAERLAEEYDLIKTGGSDCHGPGSGKFRIGEVLVPAPEFNRLKKSASE